MKDSNLRSLLTTDLQSVPFGHLGNRPGIILLTVDNGQRLDLRADDRNRTDNRPLTRRVLCRLSYVGTPPGGIFNTLRAIKQGDYTKAILKGEVNERLWHHAAPRHRQLNCSRAKGARMEV